NAYYAIEQNEIIQYTLPAIERKVLVNKQQLTPEGQRIPLQIDHYIVSNDHNKLLIYTNAKRVWRINTRGDYWVLTLSDNKLVKLGSSRPASSLMFAKFSPDGSKVAYVSEYNLYVEDLATHTIKQLTTDGNRKFINGTFDWVYEEEFSCRDGFRWSPDSKSIAFWQLDARDTRDFFIINNTDSIYSRVIPIEYPKVGQNPSPSRIGVIDVETSKITWMKIDGDPQQHYLVRLEYIPGTNELLVQQLNRKQNESKLLRCSAANGSTVVISSDKDEAWVDVIIPGDDKRSIDFRVPVYWLGSGKEFLWSSDKNGWRHLYRMQSDGSKETPVTTGNFDVISIEAIDEKNGFVYFLASPADATQQYLYRAKLNGKGKLEMITPAGLAGTHDYSISPAAKFAQHSFSNINTKPLSELVSLPLHKPLSEKESIASRIAAATGEKTTEFFKINTADGVEMDGWMVKPYNFDPAKKYPILFYVYTEPATAHVKDKYGASNNRLYAGDMRADGYIYISIDNRGTPVPKGRAWRKSIYRKIGVLNIEDQAAAAKEILKWPFVDPSRIAVWGWSGGGSATLNLMFRYPEIYKTGIAIAAVANQLTYDNIYQERYMGLPQENKADFVNGSPLTYAKNLQGNLLYIHGSGDDNVHYQNAEMLLNELIKYNKQFQFMSYPNRTHSIAEGEGTNEHLRTLFTSYLKEHCPPGGR
ncbi:MAG: S9 family peptidase, partial [Cyclobacteriaceae bacterium]|nr:S9 family peptidase [Cyclobacteriaceae bacterium]